MNDIGPQSKIELFEKISSEESKLLCMKKFENEDSVPTSPSKGNYYLPEYLDSNCDDRDR